MSSVLPALVLFASCNKSSEKEGVGIQSVGKAITPQRVSDSLGFAARIPKDADLYFASYGVSDSIHSLLETLGQELREAEGDVPEFDKTVDEAATDEDAPGDGHGDEAAASSGPAKVRRDVEWEKARQVLGRIGNEQFVYVGGGFGKQALSMAGIYQDLIATFYGSMVGGLLKKADEDGFGNLGLGDAGSLSADFEQKMFDLILNGDALRIPTLMAGWKPESSATKACLEFCQAEMKRTFGKLPEAGEVSFTAHGGEFSGYVFKGDMIFEEVLEEVKNFDPELEDTTMSREQMQRLAGAMRRMEFTVAAGVVDGYLVVYLGNGREGLQLVDSVDDSLASADSLGWTAGLSEEAPKLVGYVSKPLLETGVELMDGSRIWVEVAKAMQAPIVDVRTIAGLMEGIGKQSALLAERDVHPWSMAVLRDRGVRLETKGGWLNPGLDYDRPLRMEEASRAAQPMLRYHRMQNRGRVEQEWQMVELICSLAAVVGSELVAVIDKDSEPLLERVFEEVREVGRIYREEFHLGIGDEIAFLMDLEGEIPPIPGISQEVIDQFKGPRILYARPVLDREKVGAAGSSIVKQWRRLTEEITEKIEFDIPLIVPQKIESNGVATWYPPAPFIGGDFVPWVSLNDELWMVGNSRAMTSEFAKVYSETTGEAGTGVILELEFSPLRDWLRQVYESNKELADASMKEAMDEVDAPQVPEGFLAEDLKDWIERPQSLCYRHWKEDGQARSSLHLVLKDPPEETAE